jgi:hypothetical protein
MASCGSTCCADGPAGRLSGNAVQPQHIGLVPVGPLLPTCLLSMPGPFLMTWNTAMA